MRLLLLRYYFLALVFFTIHGVFGDQLPIVFVFTVMNCRYGLPSYIKVSLEQAVFTQPDAKVYLISNPGKCQEILEVTTNLSDIHVVDWAEIKSNRTETFLNHSKNIFGQHHQYDSLWLTSALRFFLLEDAMIHYHWKELMHVEADNLIYGRYTTLLPILRQYYHLAVTPSNVKKSFLTASVFWVNRLSSLTTFNDFLLALAMNNNGWMNKYLDYLRIYGCCKTGGIAPDKNGQGIKPFAVNEMSILAYYHNEFPASLNLLPVVPAFPFFLNRHVINMSIYSPEGSEIAHPTGHGIWDPGSWGQFIGGTFKGKKAGFADPSHIAGQAIGLSGCVVRMHCANITEYGYMTSTENLDVNNNRIARCYTAPFVRCRFSSIPGYMAPSWTPLWNLHVHSKNTKLFKSHLCNCSEGIQPAHSQSP